MSNESTSALWNLKEAAAFLKKSVRWMYDMLKRRDEEPGSIPHLRVGKTFRFEPDVLRVWVALGCPPAAVVETMSKKPGKRIAN